MRTPLNLTNENLNECEHVLKWNSAPIEDSRTHIHKKASLFENHIGNEQPIFFDEGEINEKKKTE